ncbi:MAG: DUF3788 domain-containing protein [Spirochaetales bacterium]|nr:DUF3788 domain-containing protein [Spirochaetales bacterium]
MFERLLNKEKEPTQEEIQQHLGKTHFNLLTDLETFLKNNYDINSALKFPFGNNYGWGNKYSHKSKHLFYLFFERQAFTITIQIGKNELKRFYDTFDDLSPKTRTLWESKYPCGEGGWIHYRVTTEDELVDAVKLIKIKKPPIK